MAMTRSSADGQQDIAEKHKEVTSIGQLVLLLIF